ncbi:MAG: UDP-N-acetylglucosamine 2-epimerase (non-hydrolyzing) [Candidatus Altiarchaeia archaeon]
MKVALILGTRPEIIKLSPVIRECEKRNLDYVILHTNQHYSHQMDKIFFQELELPLPDYNLNIGSGAHGEQTGKMIIGIEEILIKERPDVVLVEGDTNTVLAGALAASKLHIKIGHIEAGLRSFDRSMPEEINRVITDHISDYLFAPTVESRGNLIREGIPDEKVYITGNTIVDSVFQNLVIAETKSNKIHELGIIKGEYILVTSHRQENVDNKEKIKSIFSGLEQIYDQFNMPIIYPIHPRSKKMLRTFGILIPQGVQIIDPLGFLDFLQLEANARIVLTDSGGVQEETCILKVPCVTLRDNTERPETINAGSNVLVGTDETRILKGVEKMLERKPTWENPFGNGQTAKKILEILGC